MAGNSRNTAISPHPKPIWPGARHTAVKDGCLECLGASIVSSWPLDGEPLPWLAIPATKQWAPIPVPSCPGPVRMPGMSGSRFCDQPAPRKRTTPMAGNPRWQPSHGPHPAQHTVFTVEIKGMGKKGQKELITHPTEKNPLPFNAVKCSLRLRPYQVLGTCAELCCRWLPWAYRLLFVVNSVKLYLTAISGYSVWLLKYFKVVLGSWNLRF